MSAGTARNGVPWVPVADSTAATNSGPIAKPALPPTENTLIACWLSPLAARAARAASGWNAATPTPDIAIASQVSG
jgi:hypothetical protein